MGKGGRKQVVARNGNGGKETAADEPGSDNKTPVWRVSIMDMDGPFGWNALTKAKLLEVHRKLGDMESTKWSEILRGKSNHAMPVAVLEKEARDRLAEIGQDDIDELFQIRLSGPERIFGIRDRHVFRILWWDPDHKVYKTPKK